MLRQSAKWGRPFWPWSGSHVLWLCVIVGGCLFSVIAASVGDETVRPVRAPDFAVIEIAVQPGKQRAPLSFTVKLAETEAQRRHGLMFTPYLPKQQGMLFVFEENGEKYFHMKYTTIPLDVAFINQEGIIENIKELHPLRVTPVSSDCNAMFALEVNRGWFEKNNVRIGDKVLDI